MPVRSARSSDVRVASQWWSVVRHAIPVDVRGLWFGLLDMDPAAILGPGASWGALDEDDPDDGGTVALALTGTARFDADDAEVLWTAARVWSPPGPALRGLADAGHDGAVELVADLVRQAVDPADLPPHVEGIAAGWDDWDAGHAAGALLVWTRRDGWAR